MIFINDQFINKNDAVISAQDRGFLLGDGIFTTINYQPPNLQHLEEHYQRLSRSADIFFLPFDYNCSQLEAICYRLITENKLENKTCALRITLSRGISERGLDIPDNAHPVLLISATPYQIDSSSKRLQIAAIQRHSSAPTSHHKTLNYLDNIMARKAAINAGFDDTILLNENGYCTSTTSANLFFVKKDSVITPALHHGVLPGIMRHQVIRRCKQLMIPLSETDILPEENFWDKVDAAFITNSLTGIQIVKQIEHHQFSEQSPIITALQA